MSPGSNRIGSNDNERRADAAMQAVVAGTDCEFRMDGTAGLETDIEDLLANVRHLCDRFGLDYGARDSAAYRAYVGDFEDGKRVVEHQGPAKGSGSAHTVCVGRAASDRRRRRRRCLRVRGA
jgi:hypothetical protein